MRARVKDRHGAATADVHGGPLDDGLLQSLGLGEFVPASLAAWRPLVAEGLAFFLDRLPEPRLAAILADQLALPADASSGQRLAALFSHCPTLHKAGQVVARHRALHPELRRQLQTLESMPATVPMPEIAAHIRTELGRQPPVELAPMALAEGSVAVVVPFTYEERGELRHGVFKLLKPGIESRLADELTILAGLEDFLQVRGRALGLPALDYRETLSSVRRLLQREVRFEIEQENLRAAAAFYADDPRILVPRLLPWCTPRLTAMERVFGIKVTEAELFSGERRNLADALVASLLGAPFWNSSAQAVFHADLHAGNLLLTADRRLAVIDWSLTARLAKVEREDLMAAALGGLALDAPKVRQAVASLLGGLDPDHPGLAATVERALDRLVFQGRLPGFDWLLGLLDEVALRTGAGFREDFVLFRKTWLSLLGVLGDLVDRPSPDLPLLGLGLKRFLGELPARWRARPESSGFSTHVSNTELLRLCASPWLISVRYWTRFWDRQSPGLTLWPLLEKLAAGGTAGDSCLPSDGL